MKDKDASYQARSITIRLGLAPPCQSCCRLLKTIETRG